MQSINKLADKLSTPNHVDSSSSSSFSTTTTMNGGAMAMNGGAMAMNGGAVNITDRNIGFANDVNMSQQVNMTQQAGRVVESHQVGTVDVVETTQTVKKVPVVETTRVLETGVAGMHVHEHDHLHKHEHLEAHHNHAMGSAVHVELPVTVDTKTVVAPVVIDEHLRKDVLVEVQPVIHKEVEVQEVHHVTKHINEAAAPSVAGSVTLAPVIQEHIHTHIIEEVHPVIHREVVVQEVVHEEKHVTEHIVAPTRHITEVYTEVAPVHIHDAHCHHEIATERLTNVILPGTVGLAASNVATTVTSREVLTDRAGAAVVVGQHSAVVGGNAHLDAHGHAHGHSSTHIDTHVHGAHMEAHAHGAHMGAGMGVPMGAGMGAGYATSTTVGVPMGAGMGVPMGAGMGAGYVVDDRIHVDKVVATKHGSGMTTHHNGIVEEVILKPGDELLLEKNNITGDAVLLEKRHNGHIVADGHAHGHEHEAKHHHLHLPHFLGGHKKDETVVTETHTKHTVL